MAGMPNAVVRRAEKMLESLESQRGEAPSPSVSGGVMDDVQLSFFQLDDPSLTQIRDEISGLDIDHLTPVEALLKLHEIKKIIGG
jgi:DNA mismatch repair protein MutS